MPERSYDVPGVLLGVLFTEIPERLHYFSHIREFFVYRSLLCDEPVSYIRAVADTSQYGMCVGYEACLLFLDLRIWKVYCSHAHQTRMNT